MSRQKCFSQTIICESLKKSKELLFSVRSRSLSIAERAELATELAGLMLQAASAEETFLERRLHSLLGGMVQDPSCKALVTAMADQIFRSKDDKRIADQLIFLLRQFGVPRCLPFLERQLLFLFKRFGNSCSFLLVPIFKKAVLKVTSNFLISGEREDLLGHIKKRQKEGIRINLNQLGEAILGEEEAKKRLSLYLDDLATPEIEYISVKISTLYSQIKLVAWEESLKVLEERLKILYRAALRHFFVRPDGKCVSKFVNLDMEEYRDLHLTVELFCRVLEDPEFFHYSAGIVLQSYLPDSFLIQQQLTSWAVQRVMRGGAPIKIRLVKGANLAMERLDASLHGWKQAPYLSKGEVDANYKRMLMYSASKEHVKAVHIGLGSHNLFDIAYALILFTEREIDPYIEFEMLEGMGGAIRRVVQALSGHMLLYCPVVKKEEFASAVAYLVRRLDENTSSENFLRHAFKMIFGSKVWDEQAQLFVNSCSAINHVESSPRRTQNRFSDEINKASDIFSNEPDTDWSLIQNREWINFLLKNKKNRNLETIPLVIAGKDKSPKTLYGIGRDPAFPFDESYYYALASASDVNEALETAEKACKVWQKSLLDERLDILHRLASLLRKNRGELIAAMVLDSGKIVTEADGEVSEAIDFVEYYSIQLKKLFEMQDVSLEAKGIVLVAPPWNFPCSIPLGGIISALAAGNSVIFKPALEAVYVGWKLANLCWESGFSKDLLQFLVCEDEPIGSLLVKDSRISTILLTGATETARKMLQLRPGLDLIAETGGKNAMIITNLADRDLAIKDLVQSAFGYNGQKCSACSLAICEKEVYEDPKFRYALMDAVKSLKMGSAWDLSTVISPLIRAPGQILYKALTSLDEEESWLLEPKQDLNNPNLWSPGIKLGVSFGSFMHQKELFGPILGVMCAKDLDQAIAFANGTPYGLTSGIHSLDEREQKKWESQIIAGNCYVNRGITGAIVQRQPFGGCKDSSFGPGFKAGGPNYLIQLMKAKQTDFPLERKKASNWMEVIKNDLKNEYFSEKDLQVFTASIESYVYYYEEYFAKEHDLSHVVGQDNLLKYVPKKNILFRTSLEDSLLDQFLVIIAAEISAASLQLSGEKDAIDRFRARVWWKTLKNVTLFEETEEEWILRMQKEPVKHVRLMKDPSLKLKEALSLLSCHVVASRPLINGRLELLHYLREVSFSINYHRYGNLGIREA